MKKQVKFTFDLDCCFTVYVPSTRNVNEQTDNNEEVKHVMRVLSEMFGGATSTEAVGCWISENGQQVLERITKFYSFCTSEQAAENIGRVVGLCEWLKTEMQQEAISLEYNGQLKFI